MSQERWTITVDRLGKQCDGLKPDARVVEVVPAGALEAALEEARAWKDALGSYEREAVVDVVETLAQRDRALEELAKQWAEAHSDHCDRLVDGNCPHGDRCRWPKPSILVSGERE